MAHVSLFDRKMQFWGKKRGAHIDIINEKKYESDANNPENMYALKSSFVFGDLTGEEAKVAFEVIGFTNIALVQVGENAGWLKKVNLVEHTNFAGKMELTTEDCRKKDGRITIYCYAD